MKQSSPRGSRATSRNWLLLPGILVCLLLARPGKALAQQTCCVLAPATGLTEDVETSVVHALVELGLENVSASIRDEALIVSYENRIYRNDTRALQKVVEAVAPLAPAGARLSLVPMNGGVPLASISLPADAYCSYADGIRSIGEYTSTFRISPALEGLSEFLSGRRLENRTTGRLELILQPALAARFGNFQNSIESELALIPEARVWLWRGMSVSAQVVVPIQDDLPSFEQGLRPGLLVARQFLRLPNSTFIALSGGRFTHQRYGLDLHVRKYLFQGLLSIDLDAGRTGYLAYRRGWLYGSPDQWTYLAGISAAYPPLNLLAGTRCGQFLFEDRGCRAELTRFFGESQVGLFGIATRGGREAGFFFRVPLFPRKYLRPFSRLHVHPAPAFDWEYRYKGSPNVGLLYDTGGGLDRLFGRLPYPFLMNHLGDLSRRPNQTAVELATRKREQP